MCLQGTHVICLTEAHMLLKISLWISPASQPGPQGGEVTMSIVRWEPARELASMEIDRLNRMFANLYGDSLDRGWAPPVDIYENDNHEVVLKAELPEVKREDINITFENGVLTIRGERKY